ncbi:MAG TPA: hypothetical protein VF327_07725, partial [Gaiellaceae bacterium]
LPALRNVIVWGRAVTNVVQNLRGKANGFDDWYEPWRREMTDDPLLKFLYKQRSEILKTGTDPAMSNVTYIASFSSEDLPPAPPNAKGFFLGDQFGGNGWEVELPDGTTEKIYVSLPESVARSWSELTEVPGEHLGGRLSDRSTQNICRLYLRYLDRLLADAEDRFA